MKYLVNIFPYPVARELEVGRRGCGGDICLGAGFAEKRRGDEKLNAAVFLVNNRKWGLAVSALVEDVLEALEDVWDARSTQKAAEESPDATTHH
jgi:hypothetical protein